MTWTWWRAAPTCPWTSRPPPHPRHAGCLATPSPQHNIAAITHRGTDEAASPRGAGRRARCVVLRVGLWRHHQDSPVARADVPATPSHTLPVDTQCNESPGVRMFASGRGPHVATSVVWTAGGALLLSHTKVAKSAPAECSASREAHCCRRRDCHIKSTSSMAEQRGGGPADQRTSEPAGGSLVPSPPSATGYHSSLHATNIIIRVIIYVL